MIFKISTFLSLALALSSLEAVTAGLVPNLPGQLNRRVDSGGNITITVFGDQGVRTIVGRCNATYTTDELVVAVSGEIFNDGKNCGSRMTILGPSVSGIAKGIGARIVDVCGTCAGGDINVTPPVREQIINDLDPEFNVNSAAILRGTWSM